MPKYAGDDINLGKDQLSGSWSFETRTNIHHHSPYVSVVMKGYRLWSQPSSHVLILLHTSSITFGKLLNLSVRLTCVIHAFFSPAKWAYWLMLHIVSVRIK